MIPKTIHYCWFGRGRKPKAVQKCIASWKKYCPDYQIQEWNEDNFDVEMSPYTKYCYENKKYAFLSDYARLWVVYHYGGIYMDTDVEVVKPLDDLLECGAYYGFETKDYVNTGVGFGAEKQHRSVKKMMEQYNLNQTKLIGCPELNTAGLLELGLIQNGQYQVLEGNTVIKPIVYFNPYDNPTGMLHKTEQTYSIHWYAKSWVGACGKIRSILTRPFHRLFGNDCFRWLKR